MPQRRSLKIARVLENRPRASQLALLFLTLLDRRHQSATNHYSHCRHLRGISLPNVRVEECIYRAMSISRRRRDGRFRRCCHSSVGVGARVVKHRWHSLSGCGKEWVRSTYRTERYDEVVQSSSGLQQSVFLARTFACRTQR